MSINIESAAVAITNSQYPRRRLILHDNEPGNNRRVQEENSPCVY